MAAKFAWYLLSFTGRVTREEFWLGYVGFIAVSFLLQRSLTDLSMFALRPQARPWYRDELDFALALPKFLVAAMLMWPLIAIAAKRVHDLNRSAWWLLILPALVCGDEAFRSRPLERDLLARARRSGRDPGHPGRQSLRHRSGGEFADVASTRGPTGRSRFSHVQ